MADNPLCTVEQTGVWCSTGCATRSACRRHRKIALSPISKHRLESYRAIVEKLGREPTHGELASLWAISTSSVVRVRNIWEKKDLIPRRASRAGTY